METLKIKYCFKLADGSQEIFDLQLDKENIVLLDNSQETLPSWTELDFLKCPHCPLDSHKFQHCPLAVSLVNILTRFERLLSFDKINLKVITEERTILQDTSAQRGICSLMGLVIAASGCPFTSFFKPMARFHLPLANDEETIYRATSMYLLAQYLLMEKGETAVFDLEGLKKIYEDVQVVNTSIANRIRAASRTDSTLNAVVLLDVYAQTLPFVIERSLKQIRYLFAPFFIKGKDSKK